MARLFAIVRDETGASVCVAYFVEIHHCLLEPRGVAFLRPAVSPSLVPVTTDLHSLFRIRSEICRLCTTFTADPYVAAVRLGVIPCQFILRRLLTQSQQEHLVSNKIPHFDGRWHTEKVRTLTQRAFSKARRLFHDWGTDLFEHVVYRARWDAVAFEVDESHLLESVHDFLGRFSLFRERIRMSVFAKIDQRNSKCLRASYQIK